MDSVVKLVAFAVVAVLAAIAANNARDLAYQVNAVTVLLAAAGFFIYTIRTMGRPAVSATGYMDDVIRAGVIATAFWGYQLVIVLAATSYLLGGSQGKEYAEPAWHIDL